MIAFEASAVGNTTVKLPLEDEKSPPKAKAQTARSELVLL
jgi:hypothetical protein